MIKELLKRVRDTLHELEENHYDLYWDIQAEINKPDLKREPLSDGELNSLYYQATNQTLREQDNRLAFGFARAIEKAHGIGGGE